MYDESKYYWYYVPTDKFMQYWDKNVVDFEWVGDEVNGWIFYRRWTDIL